MPETGRGPLSGLRVLEFSALGAAPFCAMMLADMGADVVRIDRPEPDFKSRLMPEPRADLMSRGRRSIVIDLKSAAGVALALELAARADALIEGLRPGVMERIGLGPGDCLSRNARLVYGRVTGWGRTGPLAQSAGHDINYLALSGVLHMIGERNGPPIPPFNLAGDFAGGGMMLAFGILAALYERERSGQGQVVDAAMVDGAALLSTFAHGLMAVGRWQDARGSNLLDGGAHFYRCYECSDGRYVSVGPLEPEFYTRFLERAGLEPKDWPQYEPARWPELCDRLAGVMRTRSQAEWCRTFEGSDACVAPVLGLAEATRHPHNLARRTFAAQDGITQPAPSPGFSRTATALRSPPLRNDAGREAILRDWGIDLR
jgi:alpha-methylacyl-CoA racemase